MNMKRTIALVLTIAICATMALGGTLAFLTDTEEEVNIMTVGRVDIELHEQERYHWQDENNNTVTGLTDFHDPKQLLPVVNYDENNCDEFGLPNAENFVDKIVTVTNKQRSTDAWMRLLIAVPTALDGTDKEYGALHLVRENNFHTDGEGIYYDPWHYGDYWYSYRADETAWIDGIEYNVYVFQYRNVMKAGERTSCAAIVGFFFDQRMDWDDETEQYYMIAYNEDGPYRHYFDNGGFYPDGTVRIPVIAQAVQAGGFDDAGQAFDAAGLTTNPWNGENDYGAYVWVVNDEESLYHQAMHHGGEVHLGRDFTIDETLVVGGGVTLDGNGYSIDSRLEFGENEYTEPAVFVNNGTVKNIGVFGPGRGIGTRGALEGGLWVSNVTTDSGNYAFHVGNGGGWFMEIRDSEFHGWVSFGPGFSNDPESVLFENVGFVPNSDPNKDKQFNGVRAYDEATFRGCHFQEVTFDLADSFDGEVIFENCTWSVEGGEWVLLTADNVAELLKVDAEEATRIIFHND